MAVEQRDAMPIEPRAECPQCRGAGKASGWHYVQCRMCAGFGYVPARIADLYLNPRTRTR